MHDYAVVQSKVFAKEWRAIIFLEEGDIKLLIYLLSHLLICANIRLFWQVHMYVDICNK